MGESGVNGLARRREKLRIPRQGRHRGRSEEGRRGGSGEVVSCEREERLVRQVEDNIWTVWSGSGGSCESIMTDFQSPENQHLQKKKKKEPTFVLHVRCSACNPGLHDDGTRRSSQPARAFGAGTGRQAAEQKAKKTQGLTCAVGKASVPANAKSAMCRRGNGPPPRADAIWPAFSKLLWVRAKAAGMGSGWHRKHKTFEQRTVYTSADTICRYPFLKQFPAVLGGEEKSFGFIRCEAGLIRFMWRRERGVAPCIG